jgi:hypothetical protein
MRLGEMGKIVIFAGMGIGGLMEKMSIFGIVRVTNAA